MSDKARHFGENSAVAIRTTGYLPRKLRRKVKKAKKRVKKKMTEEPSPLFDTGVLVTNRSTGDNWRLERDRTTRPNSHEALGRECETLPDDLIKNKEKRLEDFD